MVLQKSNVLQYYGNMTYNLVAPDAFAKIMKFTYQICLWDAKLTWYSASAICCI